MCGTSFTRTLVHKFLRSFYYPLFFKPKYAGKSIPTFFSKNVCFKSDEEVNLTKFTSYIMAVHDVYHGTIVQFYSYLYCLNLFSIYLKHLQKFLKEYKCYLLL